MLGEVPQETAVDTEPFGFHWRGSQHELYPVCLGKSCAQWDRQGGAFIQLMPTRDDGIHTQVDVDVSAMVSVCFQSSLADLGQATL